jgi:hypothetical protein
MKLINPTPINDMASGYLIQMSHKKLIIDPDFEMTQEVSCEYYTNNNGEFGIPLIQHFNSDTNLTPDQRRRLVTTYKGFERSYSTRGNKINPLNGEIAQVNEAGIFPKVDPVTNDFVYPIFDEESETWVYPEGLIDLIDEKMMWLGTLASDVPNDTMGEKVQAMLVHSMNKMVERNRI